MIKLVVFDMAGTTVYDGDSVNRCLQEALHQRCIPASREDINSVMGIAKPVAIRHMIDRYTALTGADADQETTVIFDAFRTIMISYYRESDKVKPIEGAEQAFLELKAQGIKVGLDTGFSRDVADTILDRFCWGVGSKLVDITVTSDEVVHGRPYPDMIYRAMELLGVESTDQVAKVGDTPSDLLEGESAKCGLIIGVTEGSHTRDELLPFRHTHLVENVTKVPAIVIAF